MRSAALCVLFLTPALTVALAVAPQLASDPVPPSWTQRPGQNPTPSVKSPQPYETPQERMQREQRKELNEHRQQQAIADATRLAQLSKELQEEVGRANGATVPATAFKKADDIIKLAKSVKDKMRPL